MMETSTVSSRNAAATAAGVTMPSAPGVRKVTSKALALELAAGVDDGLVLGARSHDVAAAVAVEADCALDRQVVGFRRAGRPDDLGRPAPDGVGNLHARRLDEPARLAAREVRARRGIREAAVDREAAAHLRGDPGIDRGRRGVVEIDWTHAHQVCFAARALS
jgi:hypothetical protein